MMKNDKKFIGKIKKENENRSISYFIPLPHYFTTPFHITTNKIQHKSHQILQTQTPNPKPYFH